MHDSSHQHARSFPGEEHGHGWAFALGAGLNAGFVAAEFIFGVASHSMALVADSVHNLGDVLGLVLAWGAGWLSRRPPTRRRTYGWGRSSILASLVNAVILLLGVGAMAAEAIQRLLVPWPVAEVTVMAVAGAGILVNGATAWLFIRGRERDLNVRAVFMHMAGDAAVSLGVVIAAGLIAVTGWMWLDPTASLLIAGIILVSTWGVLRESINLAMDAVPDAVHTAEVRAYLRDLPGVYEVHDLHIWGLSTTETALTAHLVCTGGNCGPGLVHRASHDLRERFGIGHTTLQIETGPEAELCRLRPDHVV
ncbi:MAG: cation transporter [Acetobacteraceae bacterium]|nr:cation transporter [Acetobacteraceae bacterium]MBV8525479.1 cation transporter [Acetobacteraceae bacterium]